MGQAPRRRTITDIAGRRLSHIVHGLPAVPMVAAMMVRIYIGTIGMEGVLSMPNQAKEHHAPWVEQAKPRETLVAPDAKAAGAS